MTEEMSFQVSSGNCQGFSILDERVGISFHQPATVNEKVLESDFVPLCDGTTRRRSLADLRLPGFYLILYLILVLCLTL